MVVTCPFVAPDRPIVTLHEKILANFLKRDPSAVALEDGETGEKWSSTKLVQQALSVAHELPKYGFYKGDVMGYYMDNRPEFVPLLLGVSGIGGALTGVNPLYVAEELGRQLQDAGARFLFTRKAFLPVVMKALPVDFLKVIFLYDGDSKSDDRRQVPIRHLFLNNHVKQFPNVGINSKRDVVLIPYSSGTTGMPKGVMLTHENMNICFFADPSEKVSAFRIAKNGDTMLLLLPFFHMAGFLSLVWCMAYGAKGVAVPKFDPMFYLKLASEHKASYLVMVPTIMVFLAKHPDVKKFDLSSVKRVAVGAAPTGKELIRTLIKRLPSLECVTQGYGMTESGGLLTVCPDIPLDKMPMGSVGVPIPGVEMKVVSIEDGFRELGPMERGEIWGRGKGIMKGYINRPDATRETIDKDGWLHTGDIGYYDHLGHFYIVDRLKELIKFKGYQVAPAELEDLILKHPAVQEVGVVGFPDPKQPDIGELPTAFVVVKAGVTKNQKLADEIKNHVAEHTANYKHLRGGVIFRESIPKGGTGKMLRRELKSLNISSFAKL